MKNILIKRRNSEVCVSVSALVGQYLSLVVGRYDGDADWLPVLALGLTTGPYIIETFE